MIIRINENWEIHTDEHNWCLGNPVMQKRGEIILRNVTYYTNLRSCLQGCLERRLRSPEFNIIIDALDDKMELRLTKLVAKIDKVRDEIMNAVGGSE